MIQYKSFLEVSCLQLNDKLLLHVIHKCILSTIDKEK